MPKIRIEQQRFTKGEIDPKMAARGDIEQYYGSVAEAENVWGIRQGGLTTRPGLELICPLDVSHHKMMEFIVNADTKYLVVWSAGKVQIFRDGELKSTIDASSYNDGSISALNFEQMYDTMFIFNDLVKPHKIFRTNDTTWSISEVDFRYIPRYPFNLTTSTPAYNLTPSAKEGEITLTCSGGFFTADSVGQYVEGNGGRARITRYTSSTSVGAVTEVSFFNTNAMAAGTWDYLSGYEDVWSSSRGWPTSGAFYEGRLWIAGSLSCPSRIYGSRVNHFTDFNPGNILDDDAVDAELTSSDKITNIISGRSLQVFTIGSEHVASQSLGDPITPKTVNFKKQTSIGSKVNLRVFEIEGATIFTNKSSIHEFVYDDSQAAYSSGVVSLLSGHLVKDPTDFTVRKSYTDSGATYIALTNSDGTLTVSNILRSQEESAFTRNTTQNGKFINVGTDGDDIYVITERKINNQTVHYLEKFNDDRLLDCSILKEYDTATDTITGLELLEGEDVCVVADGYNMENRTVTNGAVTIERPAKKVEVGYNFVSKIKDLQVQTPNQGTTLGYKKNVSEVVLDIFDTDCISVNGKSVVFRGFGPEGNGSPLDAPPPAFSGIKKLMGFRGWDNTGQITITKDSPGKFTLLSIAKKVNF